MKWTTIIKPPYQVRSQAISSTVLVPSQQRSPISEISAFELF